MQNNRLGKKVPFLIVFLIHSVCGGCRDWITFCRKGKVQMRKTCCADSVQVGEGRGRCYVKSELFSSALLRICSVFCSLKSSGAPAMPVPDLGFWWPFPLVGVPAACPDWDCSQCKGGVTQEGQTLPGRGLRWHFGVGNKRAKSHNKRCRVGDTLRCLCGLGLSLPWRWLWRLCTSFPCPCACNFESPLACTLIIPRARLLQVCLFTSLRFGH